MNETIISCHDLLNHLDDPDWVIIDCRFNLADPEWGRRAYQQNHIPRSHYAHLDEDLSGAIIAGVTGRHPLPEVAEFVGKVVDWGISNDSQIVTYDQGPGGIAARFWWMMRWLGHTQVAVLDGGWNQWNQIDGPTTNVVSSAKRGEFRPVIQSHLLVDADQVDQIRKDESWKLVDARASERYSGLSEPIDPIAGHIEGAINLPFSANIDEDGCWQSPLVLENSYKNITKMVPPEKTVFYCGSGVTACHNILAYKHAGLGDALLYPGSWSEWLHRLS